MKRANGTGSVGAINGDRVNLRVPDPDRPGTAHRKNRIVKRGTRPDGRPETDSQFRRRAEKELERFVADLAKPSTLREKWTVQRWATERYLPSIAAAVTDRGRSRVTLSDYESILRLYVHPHVGGIELSKLTAEHVDAMDRALAKAGRSLGTRRAARGSLTRLLKHARAKGRITAVVTRDADGLSPDQRDRTKGTLEPEQAVALITTAAGTEWEPAITLLVLLGLRRGELLGLGWDAIDFEARTIRIRRRLAEVDGTVELGKTKTAGSTRTLDLSSPAMTPVLTMLRGHQRRQQRWRWAAGDMWQPPIVDHEDVEVDLVFTDEVGRHVPGSRLASAVKRIAATAGVGHVYPHLLRHTAASMMQAMGVSDADAAATLGHANAQIYRTTYVHALRSREAATVGAVAEAIGYRPAEAVGER